MHTTKLLCITMRAAVLAHDVSAVLEHGQHVLELTPLPCLES